MNKRPKNGIAKALRTPRYKPRVIQDKRAKAKQLILDIEARTICHFCNRGS